MIIFAWLAYAAIYLGFALTDASWQIWALFALYGIYYGMAEGAGKALVADTVSSEQRGTAYGLYNAAIGLAAFPASLIAGILWQGVAGWAGFGPAAPFLFGAFMARRQIAAATVGGAVHHQHMTAAGFGDEAHAHRGHPVDSAFHARGRAP